jgi:hypothetical protein
MKADVKNFLSVLRMRTNNTDHKMMVFVNDEEVTDEVAANARLYDNDVQVGVLNFNTPLLADLTTIARCFMNNSGVVMHKDNLFGFVDFFLSDANFIKGDIDLNLLRTALPQGAI